MKKQQPTKSKKFANQQIISIKSDSSKVHPALKAYFSYCFYKSAFKLRENLNTQLLKMGLIGPHLGILRLLQIDGSLSQIDLGECMGIDKATMVKLIDHLEELKLLDRTTSTSDRRLKMIEITQKGHQVLEKASAIRQNTEDQFLSTLNPQEREQLLKIIPKLLG